MAISTSAVGSGLYRSGTYFTAAISAATWSVGFWYKTDTLPTGSDEFCLWHYGDVAHVNPWMGLYHKSTGFYLKAYNGTTLTSSSVAAQQAYHAGDWVWMSTMELGGQLRFYYNSRQLFTIATTPSTYVFVERDEYLGTDLTTLGGASFAYVRTWKAWTSGQTNGSGRPLQKFFTTDYYTATAASHLTDTPLDSASSLTDAWGNEDWTAVGTISTTSEGPLDLTGGIWTDNFNQTYPLEGWTDVPNAMAVANVGCLGTAAIGCGGSGQIWKGFNGQYSEGSLRSVIWPNVTAVGASIQMFVVQASPGINDITISAGFQLVVFAEADGNIRLRVSESTGTVSYYSGGGTIANDGTPYAFQMTWEIVGSVQNIVVYLNNVAVITVTGASLPPSVNFRWWSEVSINVDSSSTRKVVFDNFEVESTAVVEDWRVCSADRVTNCVVVPVTADGIVEVLKVWDGVTGQVVLQLGAAEGGSELAAVTTGAAGAAPLTSGEVTLPAGTYYVSESSNPSYVHTITAESTGQPVTVNSDGSFTLEDGATVVVTITNTAVDVTECVVLPETAAVALECPAANPFTVCS